MSRMPQAVESERIMASAQSMIDEAREGLEQSQQAWIALGLDGTRIPAVHDAAIARGAPAWMTAAQPPISAKAQDGPSTLLQHHEMRRARKHRSMV